MRPLTALVSKRPAGGAGPLELTAQALPLAIVLALAAFMVVREGGFAPTVWLPVALGVVGLAVAVGLGGGGRFAGLPRPALAAIAANAVFVAWSYATIVWASDRGSALQGSNRDFLYLVVFALLAAWPLRAAAVWPLLLVLNAVVACEGVVTVVQALHASNINNFLIGTRLSEPLGYPNATGALFMILAWLMFGLATRPWLPAPARGLAFGLTGLDLTFNLLTESRGSVFTAPLVALVYLLLVPGRLRSLAASLVVALGVIAVLHPALHVYSAAPAQLDATLRHALELGLLAAGALAVVGFLFALVDGRLRPSTRVMRVSAISVALAAVVLTAALLATVQPWDHVDSALRSFKSSSEPQGSDSHYGGLGSDRYDFWRVGLIDFTRHPIGGIGTDNFRASYLQLGHSSEQALYPHSLIIDLLSQTGVVGTALFAGFLAAALLACLRVPPGRDRDLARLLVVGAAVFFLHGAVDWLWEMPVLGVLGLALLGTACGLAARRPAGSGPSIVGRLWTLRLGGLLAAFAAASVLVLPWLADRDVHRAETVWDAQPTLAFSLLTQASSLNPLDDQADVIAGAIASRLHRYSAMRRYFAAAVSRSSEDWYATLELGIAASLSGQRKLAAVSLARALELNPKEPVVRSVARAFRAGQTIDSDAVNADFEAGA